MNRQIILDTETTGLDYKSGNRVIEIGCVEIVNRRFTGNEFQAYLNPDRDSEERALEVHGLTTQFLSDKPRFKDIYEEFITFIKGSELLIHNATFDVGFLDNEIKLLSKKLPSLSDEVAKVTDTMSIARKKHPGQRNSLDALVRRYEIGGYDRELHGALLDSKILGDVYLALTGGQGALNFELKEAGVSQESLKEEGMVLSSDNRPRVIELSSEEIERDKEYLNQMEEETGVKPLWLET